MPDRATPDPCPCEACDGTRRITVTPETTDGRPLGPRDVPCPECSPHSTR